MNPILSILIATRDDPQIEPTVKSIRSTTDNRVEVIVCDDGCSTPLSATNPNLAATIIRHNVSQGCGPSRHDAAMVARGDWLLVIDPHSRFPKGWLDGALKYCVPGREATLYCGKCLALDSLHMDPENPPGVYFGATLNICGPDPFKPGEVQVLECNWLKSEPADDEQIPAVMGACYLMGRKFFLGMHALKGLRTWHGDEFELSAKAWLAGGEVRYARDLRVGHRFLLKGEKQTFRCPKGHVHHNKLWLAMTLFPQDLADAVVSKIHTHYWGPEYDIGARLLDRNAVHEAHKHNEAIFERDWAWLADKFGFALPN
jgi:glycosyltransferase involved in cell wall biosynthesis